MDFSKFVALNPSKEGNRRYKGVLTLVSSKKNGKRLMLSTELVETLQLGDEKAVMLGFVDKALVMGARLPGKSYAFPLKKMGRKYVLYSVSVVREISRIQNINFDTKVSHTWYSSKIDEYEGSPIAIFEPEEGEKNDEKE